MYLVTQINMYNKNLQQTHSLLWLYCIELCTRIPKHQDLLFYEFPMNWFRISKFAANYYKQVPAGTIPMSFYWISKFTARNYKEVLRALFNWVYGYSNNPLGFLEFKPEVLGWVRERGRWFDRRIRWEGSPAARVEGCRRLLSPKINRINLWAESKMGLKQKIEEDL